MPYVEPEDEDPSDLSDTDQTMGDHTYEARIPPDAQLAPILSRLLDGNEAPTVK